MKKQINPTVKAHLIRGAFYLLLLLAVCAIPFALAQTERCEAKRGQVPPASQTAPRTGPRSLLPQARRNFAGRPRGSRAQVALGPTPAPARGQRVPLANSGASVADASFGSATQPGVPAGACYVISATMARLPPACPFDVHRLPDLRRRSRPTTVSVPTAQVADFVAVNSCNPADAQGNGAHHLDFGRLGRSALPRSQSGRSDLLLPVSWGRSWTRRFSALTNQPCTQSGGTWRPLHGASAAVLDCRARIGSRCRAI